MHREENKLVSCSFLKARLIFGGLRVCLHIAKPEPPHNGHQPMIRGSGHCRGRYCWSMIGHSINSCLQIWHQGIPTWVWNFDDFEVSALRSCGINILNPNFGTTKVVPYFGVSPGVFSKAEDPLFEAPSHHAGEVPFFWGSCWWYPGGGQPFKP
jgi:hypothetical protein